MSTTWKVIYYLILVLKWCIGHLPDLELLENSVTNELYCIIRNETESTAITWETSEIEELGVSQYYPNRFYCTISTNEKCAKSMTNDVWRLDNSLNHDLNIVLDRRWESIDELHSLRFELTVRFVIVAAFKTIKTPKLLFRTLPTPGISSIDFSVAIAVKIKANAFIFLCDGYVPSRSNCYWITLADWDGKESVVRKCERGTIPSYEGTYPQGNCITKRAIIYHNFTNQLTSEKEWRLFQITIKNHTLAVSSMDENLLNYADTDKEIEVKHLSVASPMKSPGEWKINKNSDIYKTGEPYLIHAFNKPNMQFGFSVKRTNVMDHIFLYLCDKDNIFSSVCYKVTFNAHGKNAVCKLARDAYYYFYCIYDMDTLWKDFGRSTYWHHFTFTKHNEIFTFYQHGERKVIEFIDNNFTLKYLFIGSEKVVYWKVHSYGILTASGIGQTSLILFQAKKYENVCVGVFVRTSPNCNITLHLTQNGTKILESINSGRTNLWEEVRLRTRLQNDVDLYLNAFLSINQCQAYIGDIRDCNENDRILKLNRTGLKEEGLTCKSIKYPEVKIKITKTVRNATVSVKSSHAIDFTWVADTNDKHYILKYIPLRRVGCKDNQPMNVITKNVTSTDVAGLRNVKLSGLEPYTIYNVLLLNNVETTTVSQVIQTLHYERIGLDELPSISYEQDEYELYIYLTMNNCTIFNGPLFYKIIIEGLDTWTKDFHTKPIMRQVVIGVAKHNVDILGFSAYNISFEFSRNSSFSSTVQDSIIFHTYPTAPISVTNVTVYSKTNTTIWLKWKEPFPPTGQLEKYIVQYMNRDKQRIDKEVRWDAKCQIWPQFVCARLDGMIPNENYTIYVRAKNRRVSTLGNYKTPVYAFTKEERPNPPKQCNITWRDCFMTIAWEHPDIINGPLRNFYVMINEKIFVFPIEEESRAYSAIVNFTSFSARHLNITVELSNLSGYSVPLRITASSPPLTPKISGHSTFQIAGGTGGIILLDPIALVDLDGFSEIFIFIPNDTHTQFHFDCNELQNANVYLHTKLGQASVTEDIQKLNITLKEQALLSNNVKTINMVIRNSFENLHRCDSHSFSLRLESSTVITMGIFITVILLMLVSAAGIITYRCMRSSVGYS